MFSARLLVSTPSVMLNTLAKNVLGYTERPLKNEWTISCKCCCCYENLYFLLEKVYRSDYEKLPEGQ